MNLEQLPAVKRGLVWDRMIAAQDAAWDRLQALNRNFDTQVYDYLCLVAKHRADDSTTCTRTSYKWVTVYETVLPQLIDKLIDQVGTDAVRLWHNPVHPHSPDYWNNLNNLIGSINGR